MFNKIKLRNAAIVAQKELDAFVWKHATRHVLAPLLCPDVIGIVQQYADYETL